MIGRQQPELNELPGPDHLTAKLHFGGCQPGHGAVDGSAVAQHLLDRRQYRLRAGAQRVLRLWVLVQAEDRIADKAVVVT